MRQSPARYSILKVSLKYRHQKTKTWAGEESSVGKVPVEQATHIKARHSLLPQVWGEVEVRMAL